jgi:hypothetical protein
VVVGVADTAAAAVVVDMVEVEAAVSTEGAEAFMVAWAEVDFVVVVAEALPDAAFMEEALVSRAAAIEGAGSAEVTGAMVAATATAAMVVDTADTVTTITDQVL